MHVTYSHIPVKYDTTSARMHILTRAPTIADSTTVQTKRSRRKKRLDLSK